MADQIIDFNGEQHHFPSDFTDVDIAKALKSMHPTGTTAGVGKTGARLKGVPQTPALLQPMESGVHSIEEGMGQIGGGFDPTMGGLSKIARGAAGVAYPYLGAMAMGPQWLSALGGLAVGAPLGIGAEHGATAIGIPPGTSEAIGDVTGVAGGLLTGLGINKLATSGVIKAITESPTLRRAVLRQIPGLKWVGNALEEVNNYRNPTKPPGPIPPIVNPKPGTYGGPPAPETAPKAQPIPDLRYSKPGTYGGPPAPPSAAKAAPIPEVQGHSFRPEPPKAKPPVPPLRWNPKPTEEAVPAPAATPTPIQPVANAPVPKAPATGDIQVESLPQQKFHDKSGAYIGQKNIALMDRFFTDPKIKSGADVRKMSKATFDSHLQKTVNPETGNNYTATKTAADLPKGRMGRSFEYMREQIAQQYDEFLKQAGK